MTSPFSIKQNDAFLFLSEESGVVNHAVFQIKDRSYYLSVGDQSPSSHVVDCASERELVVTLHNILLFGEVDMVYSFNGITADYMKALYERNGINTWFWGSREGRMFVTRPMTMQGSLYDFAVACPGFEMPREFKDVSQVDLTADTQMAIGDIMTLLELLSFYVKFHPLTYNEK